MNEGGRKPGGERERMPSALRRLLSIGALGAALTLPAHSAGCDGVQTGTRNGVNDTLADANGADVGVDSNQVTLSPSLEELRANLEVTANRTNGGISVRLVGPGPVDLLVVLDNNTTQVRFEGGTIYQVLPDSGARMVTILDKQSGEPVAQASVSN